MALGKMILDHSVSTMEESANIADHARSSTNILDLPLAILSSILCRISDPVSAAHVICSCRLLRAAAKSASFSFRVSDPTKLDNDLGSDAATQNKYSLAVLITWTRRLLASIRSQMPMTKSLDLSGCWIIDEDVAALLADLQHLKCLILDGCQKITSAVVDALAVSVKSGPQALSLQRCFGIGPAAAGNLLAAAAAEGSQLQCVLLSHLDRLDLPRRSQAVDFEELESKVSDLSICQARRYPDTTKNWQKFHCNFTSVSGISILALHNCGNLGVHELAAVGITCPHLEYLMLGGSVEGVSLSGILEAIVHFKHLHVLETTFFPRNIVQGIRAHVQGRVEVWDFCEKKSVFSALSFLNEEIGSLSTDNVKRNNIWTFSAPKEGTKTDGVQMRSKFASIALRAAVNCSDLRRRTPLHIAGNEGDIDMVEGLLCMGASPALRDSSGATALFIAAWYGHAEICKLLLKGGADVLGRNRSGENPLYIAALRGHTSAVKVLMDHCNTNNIRWQNAEVYGDGWTPLMAAAVAERQDVATLLLEAAGADLCFDCGIDGCSICKKMKNGLPFSDGKMVNNIQDDEMTVPKASPKILDAQNRYGQTALHIAARRASVWFVCILLHAGASTNIRDEYDKRPLDIALSQKHTAVANILKKWELHLKRTRLKGKPTLCDNQSYENALSHTQKELASTKGLSKGGHKFGALKKIWREKEKCVSGLDS